MPLIDIGAPAINRTSRQLSGYTFIAEENPANASGHLYDVQLYFNSAATSVIVGTFTQVSPNTFTTRGYQNIGACPSGFSEHSIDIPVETGDYLGVYFASGYLDYDRTGVGIWYTSGEQFPALNRSFTHSSPRSLSLYAEGGEPPVPIARFTITDLTYTPNCEQVTVTVTTKEMCHLFLRFTANAPRKHPRSHMIRGIDLRADLRYCFTVYADIEQEEPGATLTHTFILNDLLFCHRYWFYFYGTSAGITMIYTSAVYGFRYPFGDPPFKTCELQEDYSLNQGYCQYWNAQSQTFTPTHTFVLDHVSLRLNKIDDTRRGPFCVKLTLVGGECSRESVLDISRSSSGALPVHDGISWTSYLKRQVTLYKDRIYRIVVHTLPGWEVWHEDHWDPWEAGAALFWWKKTATNPYARGLASTGCNFRDMSGVWSENPDDDWAFILWQRCPLWLSSPSSA